MSTFVWQVFEAGEDLAAEQHQGGAVTLQGVESVTSTPAWVIEESQRTRPINPVPGGTVELAQTGEPEGAAQNSVAESWGISRGVKNFVVIFLVVVLGTILTVVALRDSGAGNLTFTKLVEDLGFLGTGIIGGTLLKFRR